MRRVLLVFLSLAAGRALAADSWIELRSPAFTIVSDGSEKDARRVLSQLEQLRAQLKEDWPWARVDTSRPVAVLALRDDSGFGRLVPRSLEAAGGANTFGVLAVADDRNWGAVRMDVSRFQEGDETWVNPYQSAFHEYVHLILGLNFERLPAWLEEGLAEFWGNTVVDGDRVIVGRAIPVHVWTLRERGRLSAAQLFGIARGGPEFSERDRATQPFAHAWALVHLLRAGSETRRGQLGRLLDLLRSGRGAAEASAEALGEVAALERDLDAYLRRGEFATLRRPAAAETRGIERPLSAAEAAAIQAQFLSARGRAAEAAPLVAEALRLDPGLAAAHEAKALVAWRARRMDEARQALERAVQLPGASEFAHDLYGHLLWDTLKGKTGLERVEREFQRALELAPGFAKAYESLALIKEASGAGVDQTLPLALRAVGLEPSNLRFRMTAVRLTARGGQVQQARAQAEKLLAGTQGDERRQVEALIQEIADPKRLPPEAACTSGYGPACGLLGAQARDGAPGQPRNPARAVAYFQKGCAAGHAGSCSSLGFAYEDGSGVEKDPARAMPFYRKACEGGDRWSCTRLAFALASGVSIAADPAEAVRLLDASCAADDVMACAKLGSMLRVGEGVPADARRAEALLRAACGKGSAWGCGELAGLLVARGAAQDMPEAVKLLGDACETDAPGFCSMLAGVLSLGHGVPRDQARAAALYRRACDRGYQPACEKAR